MVNYIELATGRYPVSEAQIKLEHPDIIFPRPFVAPKGYALVFAAPAPAHDPVTQSVREVEPILTIKGHYEQMYEIVQLDAETVAANQTKALDATEAAYTAALEAHYDAIAATMRYDNRVTCALRAGYAGPFQAEGTAFAIWMDTCNAYGYQEIAKVKSGIRPLPTIQDFIAELPVFLRPN